MIKIDIRNKAIKTINYIYYNYKGVTKKVKDYLKNQVFEKLPENLYKRTYQKYIKIKYGNDKTKLKYNWHLKKGFTVERLFARLNRENINYVKINLNEYSEDLNEELIILCEDSQLNNIRKLSLIALTMEKKKSQYLQYQGIIFRDTTIRHSYRQN